MISLAPPVTFVFGIIDFREIIISVSLSCSHRQQSKLIMWLGLQVTRSAVLCVDTNKTARTRTLSSHSHLQLCTPAHSFHLIPSFVFLFFWSHYSIDPTFTTEYAKRPYPCWHLHSYLGSHLFSIQSDWKSKQLSFQEIISEANFVAATAV